MTKNTTNNGQRSVTYVCKEETNSTLQIGINNPQYLEISDDEDCSREHENNEHNIISDQ